MPKPEPKPRFKLTLLLLTLTLLAGTLSAQETRTRQASSAVAPTATGFPYDDEPDSTRTYEPQAIIYDSEEEPDSLLRERVFQFPKSNRDVKVRMFSNPSFDPTGAQNFNSVHTLDNNYHIDRGALGQTHLSIIPFLPSADNGLRFRFADDPNPVFRQQVHRLNLFQTLTPYTLLSYGSSLNKDYKISIIHTQNIIPRWNVAFLYDLVSRDGLYTNSDVTNHIVDITTNYYSVDARYQLQGGFSLNKLRQQENGGVQNDTTCWGYRRESGVPVNMYSAQNQWRDLGIWLHQSYNTVRQFYSLRPIIRQTADSIPTDTIIGYDTIFPHQPHIYNTGVIALDLNFSRSKRIFSDNQPDSWFYTSPLDTTFLYDSSLLYRLNAELYWTNDAYMHHRWENPMVLFFGVRPELSNVQFASDTTFTSGISEFTISPFARLEMNFHGFRLKATAEEVSGGRRNGDYRLNGDIIIPVGSLSCFDISALNEAIAPDFIYYHNQNCYSWNYSDDTFLKIKRSRLALDYSLSIPDSVKSVVRMLQTRTSATLLSNNIWFNDAMQPTQGTETALLLQASASTHLKFGWFNIKLKATLQHSSDDKVIRTPLFAGKSSMYTDSYLFRRAMRLQTGIDLRGHTLYFADGWNPVLGAFYRQDLQQVGNYIVADLWITMQVKRATIYLKASHLNAPIESLAGLTPHYFSLPHYPMEGFGLYWGLTWKFFN